MAFKISQEELFFCQKLSDDMTLCHFFLQNGIAIKTYECKLTFIKLLRAINHESNLE